MMGENQNVSNSSYKDPMFWLLGFVLLLALGNVAKALFDFSPAVLDADSYHLLVNRDFVNYWMAGQMATGGELEQLFPTDQYRVALNASFPDLITEIRGWSYPPHFILFCVPLGLLPYPMAYLAFMVVTLSFWLFAFLKGVKHFAPGMSESMITIAALLTLPFIVSQITLGQNGFLFGGAFILALVYRKDKPWVTGLMLAILTMKPHLGLLWPFLLIIEKNWKAIFWGAGFTALLMGASVAAFGLDAWYWFFEITIEAQNTVVTAWSGVFLYMMPSWFGALRAYGAGADTAILIHLVIAVPLFCAIIWAMLKTGHVGRSLLTIVGTFATLPYVFNYDLGPVIFLAALGFVITLGKAGNERRVGTIVMLLAVVTLQIWMPMTPLFRETAMAPIVFLPVIAITAFLIFQIVENSVRQRQDVLTD